MGECSRKISHKCLFNNNHLLFIIAYDYANKWSASTNSLSSSLNDVSLIWKVFRRKYCLNTDQIFIFGELDLDGKMVPWRERYFSKFPDVIPSDKKIVFYYSGHGMEDGSFCIPAGQAQIALDLLKNGKYLWYILDSCYSYRWNPPSVPLWTKVCATTMAIPIGISCKKISFFTYNFTSFLMSDSQTQDLIHWAEENGYHVESQKIHEIYK